MTTVNWQQVKEYSEIIFERAGKIAKITMNRPKRMNAFTPVTVQEMIDAFTICRDDSTIGVIILTGAGDKAFSSGGDQGVRGNGGYIGPDKIARLNVLDLQHLIRIIPSVAETSCSWSATSQLRRITPSLGKPVPRSVASTPVTVPATLPG